MLLPLSSPQRASALAIRDGFMAAHLRNPSSTRDQRPRLRLRAARRQPRRTCKRSSTAPTSSSGRCCGAEVDQVIAQAGFVPTLALNFATNDTHVPAAASINSRWRPRTRRATIAAAAIAAGAKTAIAFVPSNQRGYRDPRRFPAAFEEAGGELLDWYGYEPALQDFSQPIGGAAERDAQPRAPPAARGESRRAGAVPRSRAGARTST